MMQEQKPIQWVGQSRRELLDFSPSAVHKAGYNLGRVQLGKEPEDWKPMESIGPGASEIRVRTHEGGALQYRVLYVAKFDEAIYVLHAFSKKTQATSQHNIDVARARYAQMLRQRQDRNPSRQGGTR